MTIEQSVQTVFVDPKLPQVHQYQLLRVLGQGGMGVVYEALHVRLRRQIALKVLSPQFAASTEAISRFEREMAAIGQLSHPNIVQALDAGFDRNTHYLAMEFVDGSNLDALSVQHQQMRVADACEIIRQASLGLAHIHSFGMIHRDLKPSNLLVSNSGAVKIADLGLARIHSEIESQALTADGAIIGTYDYMSPEQANSEEAGPQSDIYSLGSTLFRLLAGHAVFSGPKYSSAIKKIQAHLNDAPPRLASLRNDVPPEVDELVQRMLAKKPSDRPQSASQITAIVSRFSRGADLQSLVKGTTSRSQLDTTTATGYAGPTQKMPASGKRFQINWVIGAGIFALSTLLCLVAWLMSREHARQDLAQLRPLISPAHLPSIPEVTQPAIPEFNSEKAEPMLWYPLLNREPTKVFWPSHLRTSLSFDPNRSTINASCNENGVLSFGEIGWKGFRLRMDLFQNHWPCDFGIFIGLRRHPEISGGFLAQGIMFRRRELPRKAPDLAVTRALLVLTPDPDGSMNVRETKKHGAVIAMPRAEVSQGFELEVLNRGLTSVRFGGVDIPQLCSESINSDFEPVDYTGPLGIVLSGTDIIVSSVQIMRVEN